MKQPNQLQGFKVDKSAIISLEKGKIPPQALDLEEVVLGAMMIDKKGVDEVIDMLSPEAFYKDAHQYIFEAIFKVSHRICLSILAIAIGLQKSGMIKTSLKQRGMPKYSQADCASLICTTKWVSQRQLLLSNIVTEILQQANS